ncbi:hypothetical protein H5410_064611 [Solanum commersonii]|uniref:Uncharacterized protein n=1 Tax=Solanum commersonii TaxID=4109 RepID=A0A9J5VYW7_SOLCO|nr:hypothetical protein H5410_064611 [Solanum commersonii]
MQQSAAVTPPAFSYFFSEAVQNVKAAAAGTVKSTKKSRCLPSPNRSSPASHVPSTLWLQDGATSTERAVGLTEVVHADPFVQILWDLAEILYNKQLLGP